MTDITYTRHAETRMQQRGHSRKGYSPHSRVGNAG